MDLTRRDALKLGVLGTAALTIPLTRNVRTTPTIKDRLPESRLPRPFTVPFKKPPVARPYKRKGNFDYYRMSIKTANVPILPDGPRTTIFGYNGVTPGPTIMADKGRVEVVRFGNRLPRNEPFGHLNTTSVHLHGNASLPQYDGWANDTTRPGFYKDYVYPNDQDVRTLWYHDHAVHHTAMNAYMGCAGFYITNEDSGMPLPQGRYDVPLMIQDKIFAKNGDFIFDDEGESSLYGDVILVNGRPWPRMRVERRKYWFRILNASVSRGYNLQLSSGEPLIVCGYDGGLGRHPQPVSSFRIGMAERYGVVIDFSKYRAGEKVILRNLELKNNEEFDNTNVVMRFDVIDGITDKRNNSVPEILHTGTNLYYPMRLTEADAVRTRKWVLERKNGLWTINGRTWDPKRPDAEPRLNSVEIWELENKSGGWFHPVHIHLIDFKILSRNGKPPPPYERGPKDVVYVGENETVRVIARFGPRRGKYMMHCHNLVHEDHDMMTNFDVGGTGRDPAKIAPPRRIRKRR